MTTLKTGGTSANNHSSAPPMQDISSFVPCHCVTYHVECSHDWCPNPRQRAITRTTHKWAMIFPGPDVRDFSRPSSAWSSSDSAVAHICHLHDLRPYGNSSCTRVAIFPFNCCFTLFIIIITIIIVIIIRRSSSSSSSFSIIWTIHQEFNNITQRRGKVHAGSKKTQWGHKVKLWPISLAQLRFRPELVCT